MVQRGRRRGHFHCVSNTEMCNIIPACLNFLGILAASHIHSALACQSAIFGKIGKNYRNLAGGIFHYSVYWPRVAWRLANYPLVRHRGEVMRYMNGCGSTWCLGCSDSSVASASYLKNVPVCYAARHSSLLFLTFNLFDLKSRTHPPCWWFPIRCPNYDNQLAFDWQYLLQGHVVLLKHPAFFGSF